MLLLSRYTRVGPSADWSVAAWVVGPSLFLLEDDTLEGCEIVQRWYAGDNYRGLPDDFRADADGHNDVIAVLARFDSVEAAITYLERR